MSVRTQPWWFSAFDRTSGAPLPFPPCGIPQVASVRSDLALLACVIAFLKVTVVVVGADKRVMKSPCTAAPSAPTGELLVITRKA